MTSQPSNPVLAIQNEAMFDFANAKTMADYEGYRDSMVTLLLSYELWGFFGENNQIEGNL